VTDAVGGVPAGWFDDPRGSRRLRYWDGAQWTRWVTDGQRSFQEPLPEDGVALARPTAAHVADVEQRFWAQVMILAAPVFFTAWGAIAVFALTHGGTQAGTFLGIVWLVGAAGTLRQPYVAILRPDGSLTFKALTRRITTTVDAIYRVSITGGRGRSYVFHFDDRKASLGMFGGQTLSRYLVERDPSIQHR
jgi:hypothetical protein